MVKAVDLTGRVFGRLTVINKETDHITKSGRKISRWLCKCSCGKSKIIRSGDLTSNRTLSCGCLGKEQRLKARTKHGHTSNSKNTKEYHTWCNLKQRCFNPNNAHYGDYAGRGITVCPEWVHSFETFYADMGDAPGPEYSIERVNNDGNYEPSNCIWATNETQQRNSRNTKLSPCLVNYIRQNKHKYTVKDLASKLGVSEVTIRLVLKYKTWADISNVAPWRLAKTWREFLLIYEYNFNCNK